MEGCSALSLTPPARHTLYIKEALSNLQLSTNGWGESRCVCIACSEGQLHCIKPGLPFLFLPDVMEGHPDKSQETPLAAAEVR